MPSDPKQLAIRNVEQLRPVALFASTAEAAAPAALLNAAGIDAQISGGTASDGLGYGLAVQKVEILVPATRADEAIQLLDQNSAARAARRYDWTCSGCCEVNGPEFDCCWACSRSRTAEDADMIPTDVEPFDPAAQTGIAGELPAADQNPYAPPLAGYQRSDAAAPARSGDERIVQKALRRIRRAVILSPFFPPLPMIAVFDSARTLRQLRDGQIVASQSLRAALNRWHLTALCLIGVILLVLFPLFQSVIVAIRELLQP
jgi:hypothetical protein